MPFGSEWEISERLSWKKGVLFGCLKNDSIPPPTRLVIFELKIPGAEGGAVAVAYQVVGQVERVGARPGDAVYPWKHGGGSQWESRDDKVRFTRVRG